VVQHAVVKRDIIWDFVKGSNALSLKEPISDPKCYVYPSGTFKTNIFWLFSRLTESRQFVDVGVNIGQTLVEIMSLNSKINYFGFEPNIEALSCARSIANSNKFEVTLLPWACSSKASPLEIYMESDADSSATTIKDIRPDIYKRVKPMQIASYPLDQVFYPISQHGFMLKVDVEGGENEVFVGASKLFKEKRPLVLCEVLHAHRSSEIDLNNSRKIALHDFLIDVGYDIFLINLSPKDREEYLGIQKIDQFPMYQLWKDSPHTCDYIFLPSELEFARN
jgi:FkbM family methyltransferase